MKKILQNLALFLLSIGIFPAHAQLFVDTGYSAEQLVTDFFQGECVEVSNITYTGYLPAMSFFEGSACNVGINAGIFITSGTATNALGPNNMSAQTYVCQQLGDIDLDSLVPGYTTYDAAVLEFDLVVEPDVTEISFNYVFGSEEYLEYVNSSFNDVFGFFITGPNPDGGEYNKFNIALVPNTNMPVAINNINDELNANYYVNNGFEDSNDPSFSSPEYIQYDGFTTPLNALAAVVGGATYHIKIAVADAGDYVLDSGVFIGIESLCGNPELRTTAEFIPQPQGDNSHTVHFQNESDYATAWTWNFGDGSTSEERHPTHSFAESGVYTVALTTSNYCCSETTLQEIIVGSTATTAASSMLTILPNPTRDILQLQATELTEVSIYNFSGVLIWKSTIFGTASVPLSQWGKGMYIVQSHNSQGSFAEKIVCQ